MSDPLAITAMGMVSSLGSAEIGCAAARAGLTRSGPISHLQCLSPDEAGLEDVIGHSVPTAYGYVGAARHIHLLLEAFKDLLNTEKKIDWQANFGFILALPSEYIALEYIIAQAEETGKVNADVEKFIQLHQKELRLKYEHAFFNALEKLVNQKFRFTRSDIVQGDQAGIASAFKIAGSWLKEGIVTKCFIGCVDSFVDPVMLEMAYDLGLIRTPENPTGFQPGEASAVVLVEPHKSQHRRRGALGIVNNYCHLTNDPHRFSNELNTGRGLSSVITQSAGNTPDKGDSIGLKIIDLNGDKWKAMEFGNAIVSSPRSIAGCHTWIPALSFGETGTATPGLSICMAIRGWIRSYAKTSKVMIISSSYSGSKAAFILEQP